MSGAGQGCNGAAPGTGLGGGGPGTEGGGESTAPTEIAGEKKGRFSLSVASARRYSATLRLWSARFWANTCPPEPSATKYRSVLRSGCVTARSEARLGLSIGPGGSPLT